MIKRVYLLLITSLTILGSSCTSTKQMVKEARSITTSLGYEVTSPEYMGELYCNVLINPIEGAGLIPQTRVKNKGTLVLPFLFYNHVKEKYQITLGETSLESPYQRFLVDAFLTECNNSACFNLYESKDSVEVGDDFILDIKVNKCQTTAQIHAKQTAIFWFNIFSFEPDFLTILNNRIRPAITKINFIVTLKHKDTIIFQKEYDKYHNFKCIPDGHSQTLDANQICVDNMTLGLSYATKEAVEEITNELSLFMLTYFHQ